MEISMRNVIHKNEFIEDYKISLIISFFLGKNIKMETNLS